MNNFKKIFEEISSKKEETGKGRSQPQFFSQAAAEARLGEIMLQTAKKSLAAGVEEKGLAAMVSFGIENIAKHALNIPPKTFFNMIKKKGKF